MGTGGRDKGVILTSAAECVELFLHVLVSIHHLTRDIKMQSACPRVPLLLHGRTGSWLGPQGPLSDHSLSRGEQQYRERPQPDSRCQATAYERQKSLRPFSSIFSLFLGNKTRLMRSSCCLYVYISVCSPNAWKPDTGTRGDGRCWQRLGKHVPTARTGELLKAVFSVRFVSYQILNMQGKFVSVLN
jgi:hypothetical protein